MTSIANKILIRQGKQDGRKYLNFSSVPFSLNENLFITCRSVYGMSDRDVNIRHSYLSLIKACRQSDYRF